MLFRSVDKIQKTKLAVRKGWNKNPDHWHELFTTQVKQFSSGFRSAAKNVKEMVLTLIVTLLQLGCQYALPWFVLKAFGKPADLVTCLAAGSMIELLTSAIPLPGGTGTEDPVAPPRGEEGKQSVAGVRAARGFSLVAVSRRHYFQKDCFEQRFPLHHAQIRPLLHLCLLPEAS